MLEKVHLIGTAHFDIKGPQRLEKLLDTYRPNAIITEGLPQKIKDEIEAVRNMQINDFITMIEIKQMMNEMDSRINPKTLHAAYSNGGYEQRVTKEYAAKHGIVCLEIDDFSAIDSMGVNLKPADMIDTLFFDLDIEKFMRKIDTMYNTGEYDALTAQELASYEKRENLWEREIRKQDGIVVFVGGADHTHGRHNNLYDKLADMDVTRVKLIETDSIS